MSLVSIGLPVVKSQFVRTALQGALQQTYQNIEIIVLNNAADQETKDDIREAVGAFADTRIKYFENATQIPMVPNWNETLKRASGTFFALLSDDDKWAPRYVEEMLLLAEEYPRTNIFHCRLVFINEYDLHTDLAPLAPRIQDHLDFIYQRIRGLSKFTLSDFTVRTAALREIGGFVNMLDGWGSDDITWFKLAATGGIAYSNKPLYFYRENSFNVSNKKGIKNKYDSIAVYVDQVNAIINDCDLVGEGEMELFKRDLIKRHLYDYKKRSCSYLVDKELRENSSLPEMTVPVFMLLYKGYKKVVGW